MLGVSAGAVAAGARSVAAITEWAAAAPAAGPGCARVRRDPLTRRGYVAGEATIGRVLARVDGQAVATTVSAWPADWLRLPGRQRRHAVAVDGKPLARHGQRRA
jgi:hypothetical protein